MKEQSIYIRWVHSLSESLMQINVLHNLAPSTGVQELKYLVEHHLSNYGEIETIRLLKSYRLYLQRIALRQCSTPIPFCKTDKDGFPRILKTWKVSKEDSVDRKRYVMTVWRSIDLLRIKPQYNIDTIVSDPQYDESLIEEITTFFKSWKGMKLLGSQPKPGYLIMSNRSGPNGPASVSCLKDLGPLKDSNQLHKSIKDLLKISFQDDLKMETYKATPSPRAIHSKLVLLSDKACKTRVIAIADWWTNVSLSGIHKSAMYALSMLEGDVTYRQDQIPNLIKGLGSELYSADMTAFTDRFPRKLVTNLINIAWPGIGSLWEQVISNRVFTHPKGDVRYTTGNPMGLLSSWPITTFTHHAVKQWCAHTIGRKKYKYLVLGDDSLDSDADVYKKYIDTIKRLGVSISLSKCTRSSSGETEFAKRLFTPEGEITGLPVDLLLQLKNKPEQFIELVRIARERGYTDQSLAPGVEILIQRNKSYKVLADILASPESVSGMRPLLSVKPGSRLEKLISIGSDDYNKSIITIARDSEFIELVSKLERAFEPPSHAGKRVEIPENHPIVFALSEKVFKYFEIGDPNDEFGVYNAWREGKYREMAQLPNINAYLYTNKGHFTTLCKYRVLQKTLALAGGDCNIPLTRFAPVSNARLFELCFTQSNNNT